MFLFVVDEQALSTQSHSLSLADVLDAFLWMVHTRCHSVGVVRQLIGLELGQVGYDILHDIDLELRVTGVLAHNLWSCLRRYRGGCHIQPGQVQDL